MELKNEQRLPVSRQKAWEALNDPDVLAACIPGCESLERVDDHNYDATVNTKVGPVKARFTGRVTLENLQPPESYTLSFEGNSGQAGFARGSADVYLDEEPDGGCRVRYDVSATVGGKLAQLGSRLVKGAAEKNASEFFGNFTRHLGGEPEGAAEEAAAGSGQAAQAEGGGDSPRTGYWPWVAGGAVVVLVIIILLL
ncbi:carbon monoxide dehydrogenase subunit G [Aquisalimonas lutea]|uniref:CoxG family protein n=1 Tax=Aquisalimonas lutea TaxID=1327750 RepID=UPI0025B4E9C8|nr:carbon monoxide dehydrogenase subunit G [Aquisalimonas lutea]MDN3519319.1 carbon monoxide dehydrogenase subunit G [Aquisalimonas lutea]